MTHTEGLLKLYREQIQRTNKGEFMNNVLESAIRKLENGVNPKSVEDWVVQLETLWNKLYPRDILVAV